MRVISQEMAAGIFPGNGPGAYGFYASEAL